MITVSNAKYVHEVLKVVMMSGAFPKRMVKCIGEDVKQIQRAARWLLQTQEIRGKTGDAPLTLKVLECCQDKYGGTLRMKENALPLLDDVFYRDAAKAHLAITNNHQFKYDEKAVLRAHRIGESVCMAYRAGCSILGNEKPSAHNADAMDFLETVYYHPAEIKSLVKSRETDEHKKRVLASSITGLILSPGGVYAIYNTGRGLMKWNDVYELSVREEINSFAKNKYVKEMADKLPMTLENAIILGKKPEQIAKIFGNTLGERASINFNLNTAYANKFFVPINAHGIFQLKMILQYRWKEQIMKALFTSEQLSLRPPFVSDMLFEHTAVLLGFDLNLMRIRTFGDSARQVGRQYKFKIACFPWQTDTLQAIMPNNVEFVIIDEETIAGILNGEERENYA